MARSHSSASHANGVIPSPNRKTDEGRANGAEPQQPEVTQPGQQDRRQHPSPGLSSRDSSLVPHTSSPPVVEDEVAEEVADEDEATPTNEELPHYLTPMTDDEFLKLQREIGYHEANRRRLIRAHIASNHAKSAADSS